MRDARWQVDEVLQTCGRFPRAFTLCENDRENGGEFCGRWMALGEAFPDAQDVGEQAKGHAWVLGALVFEEQVKEGVALLERDVEK